MDFSTLKWVKQELDATLKQARQSLEAFVDAPDDASQLRFCSAHLHQVAGTLQMVELYGASMLAEEMEKLVVALLDERVRQKDDAHDLLMRGILQLPDYLDSLINGAPDIPLALLPLLNDMRAVQGETLVSENALFTPDLQRPLPESARVEPESESLPERARRLRHQYQLGLLAWFRDQDAEGSLRQMGEVLAQVQAACREPAGQRLWWIARGVIDALVNECLDTSMATKLLLGQVDRQLKRVIDADEAALIETPPEDLLKNLLFYVARARDDDARVGAIKACYDLDALIPDEAQMAQAQQSLTGHNLELMASVTTAIKEDLARIKDALDIYLRGNDKDPATLTPAAETLDRVGDTLGMLGMGALRRQIVEQGRNVQAMLSGEAPLNEDVLLELASALLYVESALDGVMQGSVKQDDFADDDRPLDTSLPESEFNQVRGVVAGEAIRDVARAKDAVLEFLDSPDNPALLEPLPALFNQIKGSLLLLNEAQAATVVEAIGGFVAEEMLGKARALNDTELDQFADAVSSVEYYLEALQENKVLSGPVLDVAQRSIEALSGQPATDFAGRTVNLTPAQSTSRDEPADDEYDAAEMPDPPADTQAEDAIAADGATEASPETGEASESTAPPADEQTEAGIDPDAMPAGGEYALEQGTAPSEAAESEEVIDLGELVEPEAASPGDDPAAEEWAASTSGESDTGDGFEMTDALEDEEEVIEIEGLTPSEESAAWEESGAEEVIEIGAVDTGAEVIDVDSDDEVAETIDADTAPQAGATAVDSENTEAHAADAQSLPYPVIEGGDLDDDILEIFIEEATEEVEAIRQRLPGWLEAPDDKEAIGEIRRSFHTLKGSGRLVGAMLIGEFAWAFENMLNRLLDGTIERSDALCRLLSMAADTLPDMVEQIQGRATPAGNLGAMMQAADALARGEMVDPEAVSAPAPEAAEAIPVEEPTAGDTEAPQEPVGTPEEDAIHAAGMEEIEPETGAAETVSEQAEIPAEQESAANTGIDPVLFEIFDKESQDHLATIRDFMAAAEASGDASITDDLIRAVHTLHGSAHMANAEQIAEIAAEMELYAKGLCKTGIQMPEAGMRCFRDAIDRVETLIPLLARNDAEIPDYRPLVDCLQQLPRTPEQMAGEEVRPATPGRSYNWMPEEGVDPDTEVQELEAQEIEPQEIEPQEIEPQEIGAQDSDAQDNDTDEIDIQAEGGVAADEPGAIGADDEVEEIALEEVIWAAAAEQDGEDASPAEPEPVEIEEIDIPVDDADAAASLPEADSGEPAATQAEDEGDEELIEIFLEEGDDILETSEQTLQDWIAQPDNAELMAAMQRDLHTLKGGARMANLGAIGNLSHYLETLMIMANDGQVERGPALFDLMQQSQDRLVYMLEAVRGRRPVEPADDLIERIESLQRGEAPAADTPEPAATAPGAEPAAHEEPEFEVVPIPPVEQTAPAAQTPEEPAARTQQEQVRIRADLLDDMVKNAGEISLYRARMEQQVGSFRFNLGELGQTVDRIREQLRKMEIETEAQVLYRHEREVEEGTEDKDFDPLEMDRYSTLQTLSRSMMESIGDLVSIQGLLDNTARESETLLLQQSRVNTDLHEGLMRTRMVPFSGLAPRMRRIVRQVSQEVGKRAELVLEGAEGEMDRTVIDRIVAPLEHMLRNAVAHGLETPQERQAAGKAETGRIKVALRRDGSDVVIGISDDGRGMNIDAIREKAKALDFITDDTDFTDNEVMQFVLETGFSTAQEVTQISGRGVGMDVVNSEVKQLGGSLHIDSTAGQGTSFTIRLPFTLAISQALLVQVHEEIYAIPLTSIEGIVRLPQEQLSEYYADGSRRFSYAGYDYEVRYLGNMLGTGEPNMGPAMPKRLPVLLVRSGDHHMALQVDSLLGSREAVVKSVGPQISTVRGVSGATILGDGRVVLILDLGGLLRAGEIFTHIESGAPTAEAPPEDRALTVMVVDDSITVRKVTTRLLERNEMQVITAKDGVDAVAKLQEHMPDVMLLDIEMPRMDGFELATHIRNEARLQHIPIIMITSRTGDKHRQRALDIGVDFYLGKPYQEQQLLDTITDVLEERKANA